MGTYQHMHRTEEPWLGLVPDKWKPFRIKDISQLSPALSGDKPEATELCTVVPMESVSENGQIDTSNLEDFDLISSGLTNFEVGDVIFAKITPCMENGKGAYIGNLPSRYAFGSTEFHVLRPAHKVDGRFLYYYTYNSFYRGYAAVNMTGAAGQKRVPSRFLSSTRVYLPEFSQQSRISGYLDKICAAIDETIKNKHKQLETLDALGKSIIHRAVTRGLDDSVKLKESGVEFCRLVPSHWKRTKLRYEIYIRNGDFVSNKLNDNGEYPVIGGNGFMGRTDAFNVDKEVVVLGRVGAYCGNVHHLSQRSWVSDNALIVESIHNKKFLTYLFVALDFNSVANKTAQPVITGTKIKNTYVLLPPSNEQSQIADYIAFENANLTALKDNLNDQISTLEQYRKSLIHECVTGNRRITENDLKEIGVKLN